MPEEEHDKWLFEQFKRFFGGWKDHIESWKHEEPNTIRVKMKVGDWPNSGLTYIFGDNGHEDWHLSTITHPANVRV